MDVIGVGGIDFEDNIARFSSRGMTTWVRLHLFHAAALSYVGTPEWAEISKRKADALMNLSPLSERID